MSRAYLFIDLVLLVVVAYALFAHKEDVSSGEAFFWVVIMYLNGLMTGRSKHERR